MKNFFKRSLKFFFTAFLLSTILAALAPYCASQEAGSPDIDKQYQKILDQALAAFADGDYDSAREQFNRAIKLKPADPTAKKALVTMEEQMDKNKEQRHKEELEKAEGYYENKQYLAAVSAAKAILKKSPGDKDANKLMKKMHKDFAKEAEKELPNSYPWLLLKGLAASIENNYTDCIDFWEKAAKLNPNNQLLVMTLDQTKTEFSEKVKKDKKDIDSIAAPVPAPTVVESFGFKTVKEERSVSIETPKPATAETLWNEGFKAYQEGNDALAFEKMEEVLKLDPNFRNARASMLKGFYKK